MEQTVIELHAVYCSMYICMYVHKHTQNTTHQMFIDVKLPIIPHNTKLFNAYLQEGQLRKVGVSFLPQNTTFLFDNNLPVLPVQ